MVVRWGIFVPWGGGKLGKVVHRSEFVVFSEDRRCWRDVPADAGLLFGEEVKKTLSAMRSFTICFMQQVLLG